jgi:hypothetical protein
MKNLRTKERGQLHRNAEKDPRRIPRLKMHHFGDNKTVKPMTLGETIPS